MMDQILRDNGIQDKRGPEVVLVSWLLIKLILVSNKIAETLDIFNSFLDQSNSM